MLTPEQYLNKVKNKFAELGNPEVAEQQMRYMRNQFDFYGLKAPVWIPHGKQFFTKLGMFEGEDLKTFTRLCYEEDHREIHYFATEMVQKKIKKEAPDFIDFLEEMILTKSWWDTVDWISKLVNWHFKKNPDLTVPITEKWMVSNNIWLQRTAIIFQRYYKTDTNADLLFKYILQLADSKEFFIQKGAGWALRDYAKVNPKAVINFIKENDHLAPLTKREGLRILKKQGVL